MSSHSSSIIQASGISLSRGGAQLLANASLSVNIGERLAIVGSNGAGKTTLIRCLLGLADPDSGSIELNGHPLSETSRTELAQQIAYVPQQLAERISFTATEFINMSRYAHTGGASMNQFDHQGTEAVEEAIEQTNISHLRHQSLSTMSGGERQRVNIAAALAQKTPILILDEPTAHLDPKQRGLIQKLLANITKNREITLVVITHDLNWASSDFDRIIGIRDGHIEIDAQADTFMKKEVLMKVFDTELLLHPHPDSGRAMILPYSSCSSPSTSSPKS